MRQTREGAPVAELDDAALGRDACKAVRRRNQTEGPSAPRIVDCSPIGLLDRRHSRIWSRGMSRCAEPAGNGGAHIVVLPGGGEQNVSVIRRAKAQRANPIRVA